MSFRERVDAFSAEARARFGVTRRRDFREIFGVSNSAKIIEGGIQLGVPNLDAFRAPQLTLGTMIRFPPEDEVYVALQVRTDLAALLDRLAFMKARGEALKAIKGGDAPEGDTPEDEDRDAAYPDDDGSDASATGDLAYSFRNNLVATYLAHDGRIYLRNKGFWDSLRIDLPLFGPGMEVDQMLVAVWPPAASARRSLLAREFVGYLGSLVGREKVHELQVWTDAGAVSPGMRRMPSSLRVGELETAVREQGGHYPGGEVRRLHGALNFLEDKHFVILSGLSGTGKTRLALQYARAVHGLPAGAPDPFLFVCPVRPEWTDPSGLLGYFDVLSGRYEVPRFLEAVLVATAHRDSPVFVVLDELNLARVEYYLSDVLSAMETGEAMRLHQNAVPIEGTTGTPVPADLPLPPNLFLTGTINIDETTSPISAKVLDRAVVIDMSAVDLAGYLDGLVAREPDLAAPVAAVRGPLLAVQALLAPQGQGFGYRVAGEVVRYHAFAAAHLPADRDTVVDDLMVQKVLVKLRGGERQRSMLTGLLRVLEGGRGRRRL
jgi:hypothetical protein